MRPLRILILGVLGGFFGLEMSQAEVTLPAIFGDHMVLQQEATLPVWGKADPGEQVSIRLAARHAQTRADGLGNWRVTLQPLAASGTPKTLVVQGKNHLEIQDVLVGDVWIAVGEGNMEFPLSDALGGENAPEMKHDPALRLFIAEKHAALRPDHQGAGHWVLCTPETAAAFSAVGYFFARDLRSSQHLPIGMIQCTWEGTPSQAWMSREGLGAAPSFSKYLAELEERSLPSSDAQSVDQKTPSSLFNGMIAPLVPYALTGVISYQGESNEGMGAPEYRRLFPRLIRDWRKQWGQGPFPFFFVLLAGFGAEEGPVVEPFMEENHLLHRAWPWLREGAACALTLPNTGMAVATDLGVSEDRLPVDKLDVGRRLARLARKRVYGEEIVDSGPSYRSIHVEGANIRVTFDSIGGGLTLGITPFSQENSVAKLSTHLEGFAIAGADGKWFSAQGKIDGESVLLSSDAVPSPLAVRYNWRGFPLGNLYNKEGLPAAPFRSDANQPEGK